MAPRNPDRRAALLSLEQLGIKLGLDQIRALVETLGRPDHAFRSIIVAGTNGKGSVTTMIERGLRAAGYRTGRYISPHLVDLEERFVIDGHPIHADTLDEAIERTLQAATRLPAPPSFFEATTAIALDVFREARIDVAVLEVGLGGRLDATNVVDAEAAVITSVDFDHEQFLGHTLAAIAREKAGVIKRNALVILARNPPVVQEVVSTVCRDRGADLIHANDDVALDVSFRDGRAHVALTTPRRAYGTMVLALRGRHQVDNAMCAVRLLEEISVRGSLAIPETATRTAVEDVEWPGRLEQTRVAGVDVLIDGAHNPAGARALADYVGETFDRRLPMVVGTMRDKSMDGIIAALAPAAAQFVFTAASTPRAASPDDLAAIAKTVAPWIPLVTSDAPRDAIQIARTHGSPVVVAGSLYLAGEVRMMSS